MILADFWGPLGDFGIFCLIIGLIVLLCVAIWKLFPFVWAFLAIVFSIPIAICVLIWRKISGKRESAY